ncbi:MAG TPA: DUF429 domain-containing protein [Burkholderiaceae bacterium]|nr:DUF429 domain-containing protein [Burkholderiaceae bacterium]
MCAAANPTEPGPIVGVDFTCAPTPRKPQTLAFGRISAGPAASQRTTMLRIDRIERHPSFEPFDRWLNSGPWVAGFDFPFGLPRDFVDACGWREHGPDAWAAITRRIAALERSALVAACRDYCARRPAGSKLAHRATDGPAGSSPSMKWVNPPVAQMLHAGAPRLVAAGVTVPGLRDGDPARIALEAYPGLLARDVLGRRSYKSDDRRKDDALRRDARRDLVAALERGRHRFGIAVDFGDWREPCIADPMADLLDAVLCAVQAAWGWQRRDANWGLPQRDDRTEGWIVGA